MRKFFCLLSFSVPFFILKISAEPLNLSVKADSAILMNAESGAILFQKNPHDLHYPASITKIATAMLLIKVAKDRLDEIVTADHDALATITEEARLRSNYSVPAYWLVPGGTHMGIKKGEQLTLKDLLYGMMVSSANDASNVIAQHVGGTVPKFMEQVNVLLKELGCTKTNFCNPHGLFHPKHQTTAYDMALIAREALKDTIFREVVSTVRFNRPKTNKQESVPMLQTNRLLRQGAFYYPKAIGVKTGYLSKAQHTFVAAAQQTDGRILIAVLMHCKERNSILQDAINLFEAAFNQPKVQKTLLKAGPQKFQKEIRGAERPIQTYLAESVSMEYYPAEDPNPKCFLYWKELSLPIIKGQEVAELQLKDEKGQILKKTSLLATDDVNFTWAHWLKGKLSVLFCPGIGMAIFWGALLTILITFFLPRFKAR